MLSLEDHQIIHQWFGVTHLFRSNDALNAFTDSLAARAAEEQAISAADDGVVAEAAVVGLSAPPVIAAVGTGAVVTQVLAGDLQAMSSDIKSYNETYPNDKIGVNIMFAFTWHNFTFTD